VKDSLGRLWKVGKSKEGGSVFTCYTKSPSGSMVVHGEADIALPAGPHVSRVRKGGMACNGHLYGPPNFQICSKCAALVVAR